MGDEDDRGRVVTRRTSGSLYGSNKGRVPETRTKKPDIKRRKTYGTDLDRNSRVGLIQESISGTRRLP